MSYVLSYLFFKRKLVSRNMCILWAGMVLEWKVKIQTLKNVPWAKKNSKKFWGISHLYPFWNGGKIPQSDSMRSGYYTAAKAAKGRREVFSLRRSFFKGGSTTFSKSLSFSSQHANLSFANEKRKIITTIVIKIRLFQRP